MSFKIFLSSTNNLSTHGTHDDQALPKPLVYVKAFCVVVAKLCVIAKVHVGKLQIFAAEI
jgi:hypothetical protein